MRIYALAKDLDIDSKDLVEYCRKAGIPGKGSALASLDDEEIAKLKAYLGGEKRKGEAAEASRAGAAGRTSEASPYTRDDYIAVSTPAKIRNLDTGARRPGPLARPPLPRPVAAPAAEPPPVPPAPEPSVPAIAPEPSPPPLETTPAEVAPPSEVPEVTAPVVESPAEPSVPVGPTAPAPPAAPVLPPELAAPERPSLLRPTTVRPLEKMLEKRQEKTSDGESQRPKRRREPVIKLANMPEVKQPTGRKPVEPKAQKPEIRLPKDAIIGHRAGQRAPLEQLAKAAEEKAAAEAAPAAPPGAPDRRRGAKAPAGPVEAPLSGKGSSKRQKRGGGPEEESESNLAGMASARADRQKLRKQRTTGKTVPAAGEEDREPTGPTRRPRTLVRARKHSVNTAAPRKEKVTVDLPCTVRSFSEATGVSSGQLLKALMGMGVTTLNINAQLENEMAQLLAAELTLDVEFKQAASVEQTMLAGLEHEPDAPESLVPRPPVATFLGHVDHGKTSLLDAIIGTRVAAGEAGGITQHIRAYQIEKNGRKISFVDTPGHEAFTEMRARGANVTDVAVLVVAADDGVMPQTEEAISHARAAGVPIIIALNKVDLPGVDVNRVMQQLAAQNLLPSEWGGDVEVIQTSATKGTGISELLETILLTADMNEYKANPARRATGVCLEAAQEAGRGVMAKLVVQNGTLRPGDVIVCGSAQGRIKAMYDTLQIHERVAEAGPSTPVNVTGFDQPPQAGERFHVLENIGQAREIADLRAERSRARSLSGSTVRVSFEEFQRRLAGGNLIDKADVVTLNLIVRADTRGSIEAIEKEMGKLEHPEVQVRILHKAVGAITAGDIMLAHASEAVIIGFSVIPDEAARALAEEKQVEIRRYDIIYKVTDDIKALLEGKLKPEERVVELGHALVKRVFTISKAGTVAGCYVIRGSIARGCRVRVNRDGRTIGDYALESLRREKDDIKEVPRGMECGMKLAGFNDIKQDDILEAYRIEEFARTL